MAVGSVISAARYNAIQSQVEQVLGVGSGRFGYNNTVTSAPVSSGSGTVNEVHMSALKADLTDAYVHQTGSSPTPLTSVAVADDITDAVYLEYETIGNYIYLNKDDLYASTQASVESKVSSSRGTSSPWGDISSRETITHEFTVTFTDANHRRAFFNAGGQVRVSTTVTNASGAKASDWASMMSAVGTVAMDRSQTTASSPGTSVGNYDLNTTYQTIFTKSGSGVYASNSYTIKAKADSDTVLRFKIEFYDGIPAIGAGGTDEAVIADITSSVSQLRATGSYVSVPTPTYANVSTL